MRPASIRQSTTPSTTAGRSRRTRKRPIRFLISSAGAAAATLAAWIQRPWSTTWTTTRGSVSPCPERSAANAGGAACGDLIRIALRFGQAASWTSARPAPDARRRSAAAAAVAELADGAGLREAALIGACRRLGGARRAEPGRRPRRRPRRRGAASGARCRRRDARPVRSSTRRRTDPSGCSSPSAAASTAPSPRCASASGGAEVLAVTLELWSDPANDGERSCCSADAVRPARSVAHSLRAFPHLTIDLRDALPRRGRRAVPRAATPPGSRRTRACAATGGPDRADDRDRRAPRRRRASRPATTRGSPTTARARCSPPPPTRPRIRPTCSPGFSPAALGRLRFPLGDLTKPGSARSPARPGLPVADEAESQDLCFLAGEGKAGFLARHGGLADREGEIADAAGTRPRLPPRPSPLHRRPAPRASASASPVPLYVLATDAEANRVVVGPRRELETAPRRDPRRRSCTGPATGSARSGSATARGRSPAGSACPPRTEAPARRPPRAPRAGARGAGTRGRRRARRRSSSTAISSSATARSPDQCPRAPGHGAGSRRLRRRELGGNPRDISVVLRGARAPARALGFADPCPDDPTAAHRRRDAAVPALLPRRGDAAGAAALLLPALLPHARHRGGRQHRPAPDLLRDARQLLASATTSSRRRSVRHGSSRCEGVRLRPRADLDHGLRRATRSSGSAPTRRRSSSGEALGVPAERIVGLPRKENFWQAGTTGPCGPCSELYLDRGEAFGAADDRPGDDTDRFLEYWNLVFTAYELHEDGSLTELPAKNIDTGLGLERMAVIQQGVDSVFDTDLLRPARRPRRRALRPSLRRATTTAATRAMRIIADHARGAVQLLADGVVPSNERPRLRPPPGDAPRDPPGPRARPRAALPRPLRRARDRDARPVNPAVVAERETIMRWVDAEEESFGRTLDRGSQLLERLIDERSRLEHLLDLRRRRLRAPRHLRLPL